MPATQQRFGQNKRCLKQVDATYWARAAAEATGQQQQQQLAYNSHAILIDSTILVQLLIANMALFRRGK